MPLFDFQCRACAHIFEEMVSDTETPVCPQCGKAETERLLSAPNLKTGAMPFKVGPVRPMPPRPKGGCSGGCGSCGSI